MREPYLILKNISVNIGSDLVLEKINLELIPNRLTVIFGKSGAGKTILAETIAGKRSYSGELKWNINKKPSVTIVGQQYSYKNKSNLAGNFYYQQRFNATENEDAITAREFLDANGNKQESFEWAEKLRIIPILDEPVIQLSNGESKRLHLAKALANKRDLLILDDPFTGIDERGREIILNIIENILISGQQLLIFLSGGQTKINADAYFELKDGKLIPAKGSAQNSGSLTLPHLVHFSARPEHHFRTAIRLINTNVTYGEKKVLNNVNWTVKKGEKWNLAGENGAGKSTLLSLLTGDHPQAYNNEIYLFDRRRGSGESIWDIKKLIGYISPELHQYFDKSVTIFSTIGSGLFDTIGLFKKPDTKQKELINNWLDVFNLQDAKFRPLYEVPRSKQRLALIARALIKNAPMLILDEPCQGLADEQVELVKFLIDELCKKNETTLINVTHYREQIPSIVHNFAEIKNGEVIVIENENML